MAGRESEGQVEKYCFDCGELMNARAKRCPSCDLSDETVGQRDHNRKYCPDCGHTMERKASACPNCGVGQPAPSNYSYDADVRELQKTAEKSKDRAMVWSLIFSSYGYIYAERPKLALLNFFTLNYFFLGLVIVPYHTARIIGEAQDQLDDRGIVY